MVPGFLPKLDVVDAVWLCNPWGGIQLILRKVSAAESLELHSYSTGANVSSKASALGKAFWWGDEEAGVDADNAANLNLPRSLNKVVALMGSRFADVREQAVVALHELLSSTKQHIAIAAVPGALHSLVELLADETLVSLAGDAHVHSKIVNDSHILARLIVNLKDRSGRVSEMSGWVLWCLANPGAEGASASSGAQGCLQNIVALLDAAGLSSHFGELLSVLCNNRCKPVASTPAFFESLFSLALSERVDLQIAAAESLQTLGREAESRKLIVQVPEWLQTLTGLVDKGRGSVAEKAANVLRDLAASDGAVRGAIAADAGALQVLVSCLVGESTPVQQPVAALLSALARNATTRQAVVGAYAGCLQGLTAALKDGSAAVQKAALEALWVVGTDDGAREELLNVPELVPALADMLDDKRPEAVVKAAVGALQSITGFPAIGECTADTPGCLQRLVQLLQCGSGRVRTCAAFVFSQLAADAGFQKVVAEEPGAIEQLVSLLGVGGPEGAHRPAARALHTLAWDLECRPLISAAPACLEQLFNLFKGPQDYVQSAAGEVLWFTAVGSASKDAFWERPGVVEELVDLLGENRTGIQRALSARILHNLTHDDKGQVDEAKTREIAAAPGCMERLFGLLKCSESSVAQWGLSALRALAAVPEIRTVVFGEPGFLQTLVGFLDLDALDESMLDVAPRVLHQLLSADAKNREAFLSTPGGLERLVLRGRIAGIPGALHKLVELLKPYWMREVALEALSVFAADNENGRAIAAVPECLTTLQTLASLPVAEIQEGEDPGLRELAAGVLSILGGAAEREGPPKQDAGGAEGAESGDGSEGSGTSEGSETSEENGVPNERDDPLIQRLMQQSLDRQHGIDGRGLLST
ncbi:hypothetical protein KFL_001890120 [Klebsormidium nitens]|uniref:Vacuolar protein 8 n=1 Tax=Klebsormidium nitens TaxID=105231 RepID=A0A1Y1I8M5_KLENI|nr:hypothetical protein KFL_001890120 [Klebsormidium nitens]|eukprot:GAQ84448.1 hypothetical protein KFL_001890120 [Klebsormidium nitens]